MLQDKKNLTQILLVEAMDAPVLRPGLPPLVPLPEVHQLGQDLPLSQAAGLRPPAGVDQYSTVSGGIGGEVVVTYRTGYMVCTLVWCGVSGGEAGVVVASSLW